MKKRFVWLAIVALAVGLSGCRITVHPRFAALAPSSLVGYSLVLTNSTRSGVLPADRETYHFKSPTAAFDASLDQARSWLYERKNYDTATVLVVFALSGSTDLLIRCDLTFKSKTGGTHQCAYSHRTYTTILDFTLTGSSAGTFRLDEIP